MADFFFWFLVLLLFVAVLAWPTWPYTHKRWPSHRQAAPSRTFRKMEENNEQR